MQVPYLLHISTQHLYSVHTYLFHLIFIWNVCGGAISLLFPVKPKSSNENLVRLIKKSKISTYINNNTITLFIDSLYSQISTVVGLCKCLIPVTACHFPDVIYVSLICVISNDRWYNEHLCVKNCPSVFLFTRQLRPEYLLL